MDADRWVNCSCHRRHWGAYGAAGLLQAAFETAGKADTVVTHRPIQGKPRLSGAHEPSPPDPPARPV